MFNLQGGELIIILLLALVVLGPEKLPDAMRKAGQLYAELKKMSSGFQEEFKSVVDEPMREMRDTANLLRDSADFRQFEAGERDEKPKSAEMVAAADPDAVPVAEVPTFESDGDVAPSADSGEVEDEPHDPPEPFSGAQQSSAAPRVPESADAADGAGAADRADDRPVDERDDEAHDEEPTA